MESPCEFCDLVGIFEVTADGPTRYGCLDHVGVVIMALSLKYPDNLISVTVMGGE